MNIFLRITAVILALFAFAAVFCFYSSSEELPENLYSKDESPKGVYYKAGKEEKGTKYLATNLCLLSGAEKVFAGIMAYDRTNAIPYFEFYDADGAFLSDAFSTDVTIEKLSRYFGIISADVPSQASGVRVNFSASDLTPVVTTKSFTYEEYITITETTKNPVRKSVLNGKKILFCGDSICEATVEKNNPAHAQIAGWAGRIGTYNDMEFINKGLGGAAFSYFNPEKNPTYLILTQLKSLASEADTFDLVLLHGGVNDMWDKVPMGEMSESRDPKDFDMETFAGAMETTFCYAKETYKNASIGFLINFRTNSSWGYLNNYAKMKEYWDLAKQICDKWEIPYYDMFGRTEFKRMRIPTDHGGDGIHPIYEGYEMLYPYIEQFVESLVPAPIDPPTETPTEEPTETPTEVPTESPTEVPTEAPTESPTEVVTETPTEVPTEVETTTETPSSPEPEEKNSVLPFIIGGAAAAAAGAVAAAVVVKKKKKH